MRVAITRAPGPRLGECELTWMERAPIDGTRALAEHLEYERQLAAHGWMVVRAEDAPDLSDAVFVEDTAVVLDEVAIVTRPGAESRRGELHGIMRALAPYRSLLAVEPPATLDGGDVLRLGRTLHVGVGGRTNAAGASRLCELAEPFGYTVVETRFSGCLHLKTAATSIGAGRALLNPACVDPGAFDAEIVEIDPGEPSGANALILDEGTLLLPASAPRTRARLEALGMRVVSVDIAELEKAEAGVTCCSILVHSLR
ncbi:MAG: dimethylarginine dimethylaminohydrolase family protein [Thermoanaerobaculia bacterium]